jgi:dTMP kinase
MTKALFVAFEGCEGSGKTTQAELLRDRLSEYGIPSSLVHEPGTTALGSHLRNYLKSQLPLNKKAELLLFEAARAQLVTDEIQPSLEKGHVVITDRYAASSLAYQGYGRKINRKLIQTLNEFATSGLNPDLTILLDIDPAEGLRRVGAPQLALPIEQDDSTELGRLDVEGHRRFEDQPLNFHTRVRAGYLSIAKQQGDSWLVIDARKSESEVTDEVWSQLSGRFSRKPNTKENLQLTIEG